MPDGAAPVKFFPPLRALLADRSEHQPALKDRISPSIKACLSHIFQANLGHEQNLSFNAFRSGSFDA